MNMPRIMLAAPRSGSGKTTVTCAFLEALKASGKNIQAFKCGPDYIDPMFHRNVLGIPSVNLDTFFVDHSTVKDVFIEHATESKADICVVEGVMGLYDGLGIYREEGSSYDLAVALQCPIILVIDGRGMGRSVEAEIAGFLSMDKQYLIKGVILNMTSKAVFDALSHEIESRFGIKALGYLPNGKEHFVRKRHLGLLMPHEVENLRENIQGIAKQMQETVSLSQMLAIATQADRIYSGSMTGEEEEKPAKVRIGIAKDEAFSFYYEDNLRMLKKLGAELVLFSPLRDEHLPEKLDGFYIGGGYPELHCEALSANETMRKSIRDAVDSGMPSIAECGGFMYLHETITDEDGKVFKMVGAIPGDCVNTGRSLRFGYLNITENEPHFLPEGKVIRGHEYHYCESQTNGEDCVAEKPVSEKKWKCVMETDSTWWGFPHLYWRSAPEFAEHFVNACAEYRKTKAGKSC